MVSNEILSHLAQYFNLKGTLSPLAGELDLNYKLDTNQGGSFIVKISRDRETIASIPFQEALVLHLKNRDFKGKTPAIIPNLKGSYKSAIEINGQTAILRVLEWMDGRLWSQTNPILSNLRYGLGNHLGQIAQSLQGFTHPFAQRNFEWDLSQCLWVRQHLHLFKASELALINPFISDFKTHQETYNQLPKSVIHNDANDHNIIVSHALIQPEIIGLIDYGDACYSQTINDLAIACTYGIMGTENPLAACLPIVKGYHESHPLSEQELLHLYHLIGMRLVVSLTKAAMNKKEHPENKYLFISEKPAWELLEKWRRINTKLAYYAFRKACNYKAHPNAT
ncbi:phosphotransferase, partial [Flavobacteriaceae bacterium]|nr:phosphotransferase [Flavobacteriaceae bacterium]